MSLFRHSLSSGFAEVAIANNFIVFKITANGEVVQGIILDESSQWLSQLPQQAIQKHMDEEIIRD